MTDTPLILELEQVHHCVSRDVSERITDTKIKWLATLSIDENTVTNMFELDNEYLQEVVQKSKQLKEVKKVKVVQKTDTKSWISLRADKCIATAPKLVKSGCIWLHPVWSEDGVDRITMFAPTFKNFRNFLDLVEDDYQVKVRSKRYLDAGEKINFDTFSSNGFLQLKSATELLTERQYELFDLACRYGYYEEPKKISLQEIGAKLGICESTSAELLRKAERKLMPVLSDILRAMR